MIQIVAKTEAYIVHPFLVREVHEWYDTSKKTSTPEVIRRSIQYRIQWQNIKKSIKNWNLLWDLSNMQYSPRLATRGAVSVVSNTATGIKEGAAHATITNFTFTHDATSSDILVLGVSADSPTTTVSATYNSASLTQAIISQATDRRTAWIGYKGSPTTGSNTVSVTYGTSTAGFGVATTYTGSNGTMNNGVAANGTSKDFSLNVTSPVGDIAYDVCTCGGTQTVTAGASQTVRLTGNDSYWHYARASDQSTHTGGTATMSWTRGTSTANFTHAAANIVQGSGSAIKTINGLARASIKTVNGLAIASVKTKNGLA